MEQDDIDLSSRIGLAIKRLREHHRYTQEALSEKTGIPRSQLSMMENGKANKRINLNALRRLARELGLPDLATLIAWAEQDLSAPEPRLAFDPVPRMETQPAEQA